MRPSRADHTPRGTRPPPRGAVPAPGLAADEVRAGPAPDAREGTR
ncbi:hypothetical protein AB0G32_40005 [Streptomyces sp. NPDC023723]